jgi:hypothetical protein
MEYSIQELILLRNYFYEKYGTYQKNYKKSKQYLDIIKIIEHKLLKIGETFKSE